MKITEMNNEQAAETLIRIADPIGNICDDKEAAYLMRFIADAGDTPLIETIGKLIPKAVAFLMKSHKKDLYEIIGGLTFQTVAQVEKMNFIETVNVLRESYDEVLSGFFTSSTKRNRKSGEK